MAEGSGPNFRPPRSITAFGVSSLLADNCRVFYDSIFTTRHLGRVADLLSARLQKAEPDELRLRALLLFLAYEGFRCQFPIELKQDEDDDAPALLSPLTIECGIDDEKIAVGVSFDPHFTQQINVEGLEERIRSHSPSNRVERALLQLLSHSGQVFLRRQPSTGRLEVIALTGIGDHAKVADATGTLTLHEIPQDPDTAPRAQQYSELGDEAYADLLKDEQKGRGEAKDNEDGESRFGGDEDEDEESTKKLGKDDKKADRNRKVISKKKVTDSSQSISGDDEEEESDDIDGKSSSKKDDDGSQKVGGREPERRGRMKASAGEDDEPAENADDEDVRLGKGGERKAGGRKLGMKGSEEETADADSDDEELRMGSGGQGPRSRKIGVKGKSEGASGDEDSEEGDEEVRLGSGYGRGKRERSQEEQASDAKAIQEFDDSKVDPSNVSADQVERYREQIKRMSRRLVDLEEDRSKWMRMVKADGEKARKGFGSKDPDSQSLQETRGDDRDDELKLKSLSKREELKESEPDGTDEESESSERKNNKTDEMRIKSAKKKDGANQDDDAQGENESAEDEAEQPKKKPAGFLKRLFGGAKEEVKDAKKSENEEDSDERIESKKRSASDDEEEDSEKPAKKKKRGFFGTDQAEEDGENSNNGDANTGKEDRKVKSKSDDNPPEEDIEKSSKLKSDDPAEKSEGLVEDIEKGTFHQKMSKSKEELDAIRERIKDERVKNWADGMMSEIMKEKARLGEMARNLNQAVRAKEAEFQRKTQFLKQEVLNRDDQIRKGQLAVNRVREQLSLTISGSERLKVQIATMETQESASRQKVQTSERLVQVAKEEAMAALRQAEMLKAQIAQTGVAAKRVELAQKEIMAAKVQTEKAMKQVEDMKKLNGQLTEKLTAATQATSGAGGTEDLKRKLEATGRLAAVHKKEAETFRAKMETTVKEEARLRSEVTKLQAEMKRMKAHSGIAAAAAGGQPAAVGVKKPGGPGGKAA